MCGTGEEPRVQLENVISIYSYERKELWGINLTHFLGFNNVKEYTALWLMEKCWSSERHWCPTAPWNSDPECWFLFEVLYILCELDYFTCYKASLAWQQSNVFFSFFLSNGSLAYQQWYEFIVPEDKAQSWREWVGWGGVGWVFY